MIIFIIVLVVAFLLGTFGFSQVIGSIQNISIRPMLIFTMVLWIAILIGGLLLAKKIVPDNMLALYIGYGISFVIVLGQGKIE